MKDTNKSIKVNNVNRQSFTDQFKDTGTKITDEHLPTSINQDMELLNVALWGVWQAEANLENALPEMVSLLQDLSCKIRKLTEFAELSRYATGFEIPEDKTFQYINVKALAEDTNE